MRVVDVRASEGLGCPAGGPQRPWRARGALGPGDHGRPALATTAAVPAPAPRESVAAGDGLAAATTASRAPRRAESATAPAGPHRPDDVDRAPRLSWSRPLGSSREEVVPASWRPQLRDLTEPNGAPGRPGEAPFGFRRSRRSRRGPFRSRRPRALPEHPAGAIDVFASGIPGRWCPGDEVPSGAPKRSPPGRSGDSERTSLTPFRSPHLLPAALGGPRGHPGRRRCRGVHRPPGDRGSRAGDRSRKSSDELSSNRVLFPTLSSRRLRAPAARRCTNGAAAVGQHVHPRLKAAPAGELRPPRGGPRPTRSAAPRHQGDCMADRGHGRLQHRGGAE